MAELVVAPFLEPFEDRVEALVGVLLEVAEDGDVAGVADLLREIGGVVDELRLEVGVFLGLGQEAEIDADAGFLQRVVDEAGVAGLVAGHVAEELADVGVLAAALHLLVEHAAGEFGRERGDEEVGELLAELGVHVLPVGLVPLGVLLEVLLVGVRLHLGDEHVPFGADRGHVDPVHLVEIGGVEARIEQGRLGGHRLGVERLAVRRLDGDFSDFRDGVHSLISSEKLNSQSSMTSRSPVSRVQARSRRLARVIVAVRFSVMTSP